MGHGAPIAYPRAYIANNYLSSGRSWLCLAIALI